MLVPKEDSQSRFHKVYQLSEKSPNLAGIDNCNLDLWVTGLSNGVFVSEFVAPPKKYILTSLQTKFSNGRADWLRQFYADFHEQFAKTYMTEELYMQLAQAIDESKLEIRKMRYRGVRPAIKLLEYLVQETLYVKSVRFPSSKSIVVFGNTKINKGDFVLSTSDEMSDRFFARMSDSPDDYTRISAVMKNSQVISSVETDNTYIYRYNGLNQKSARVAFNKLSKLDGGEAFSAQAVAEIYKSSTLLDADSPYPKSYWSVWSQSNSEFSKWLGKNNNVHPMPADVELNANYEVVGRKISLVSAKKNRVMNAVVDVFVDELNRNDEFVREYIKDKNSFFGFISSQVLPEIESKVNKTEAEGRLLGLNSLRVMVHKNLPKYFDQYIATKLN